MSNRARAVRLAAPLAGFALALAAAAGAGPSAQADSVDDCAAGATTTCAIGGASNYTGTMNDAGDIDWIYLKPVTTDRYQITVEVPSGGKILVRIVNAAKPSETLVQAASAGETSVTLTDNIRLKYKEVYYVIVRNAGETTDFAYTVWLADRVVVNPTPVGGGFLAFLKKLLSFFFPFVSRFS